MRPIHAAWSASATRALRFLLTYRDYMAVGVAGSEDATIHGIIQSGIAKTASKLTGITVVVRGREVEALKRGIRKWRQWPANQDPERPAQRPTCCPSTAPQAIHHHGG